MPVKALNKSPSAEIEFGTSPVKTSNKTPTKSAQKIEEESKVANNVSTKTTQKSNITQNGLKDQTLIAQLDQDVKKARNAFNFFNAEYVKNLRM